MNVGLWMTSVDLQTKALYDTDMGGETVCQHASHNLLYNRLVEL